MPTNDNAKPLLPALRRLGLPELTGCAHLEITGVSYDSRQVEPGHAFFCIEGQKMDGNKFIADAIGRGAACIFSERASDRPLSVPLIEVPDTKLALGLVADQFFDHPSSQLRLIGVTGTNGKTTTTHLVEHVLKEAGKRCGIVGTLGARWTCDQGESIQKATNQADTEDSEGKKDSEAKKDSEGKKGSEGKKVQDDKEESKSAYLDLHHTTPQASDLQALLSKMVEKRQSHVAMEVSSHALALKRVAGCEFAVACLTNVTQDHLDFHKTMEHYWKSKRMLFEMLDASSQKNKTAVINADEALAQEFMKSIQNQSNSAKIWTYGWNAPADAHVIAADFHFKGTRLQIQTPQGPLALNLKLSGRFNVYNVMAAVLICLAEGVDLLECKQALEKFKGVPGRFETVASFDEGEACAREVAEPLCLVDYAHTPDGLDNVLKAARALLPDQGRLIAVFGCGGDRDSSKRPQMGEIAEKQADDVIVTSDNPRSEDPQQIIAEILAGIRRMKHVKVEPDRARAIRAAVQRASDRDIIVVAGKGHETYQILADRTIDFDDRVEVRKALEARLAAK